MGKFQSRCRDSELCDCSTAIRIAIAKCFSPVAGIQSFATSFLLLYVAKQLSFSPVAGIQSFATPPPIDPLFPPMLRFSPVAGIQSFATASGNRLFTISRVLSDNYVGQTTIT